MREMHKICAPNTPLDKDQPTRCCRSQAFIIRKKGSLGNGKQKGSLGNDKQSIA